MDDINWAKPEKQPTAMPPKTATVTPAVVALEPETPNSRTYKRNEYPALNIVRIALLVIACLAFAQWVFFSGITIISAISAAASSEESSELPADLVGKSMFDRDLTEQQRRVIVEHESQQMQAGVRGGIVAFSVFGLAINTFSTALFICFTVASSELIKLAIDVQANTQHTAANA